MTTLTEVFPCFFLSCKANARVKPAKTGHGPHSSQLLCCSMYFCVLRIVCFVMFPVLFVCICVLNNCHQVATQLQLNIPYHMSGEYGFICAFSYLVTNKHKTYNKPSTQTLSKDSGIKKNELQAISFNYITIQEQNLYNQISSEYRVQSSFVYTKK